MLAQYACILFDRPVCTDIVEHQIKLRPNAIPVSQRPNRLSSSNISKLKADIDSLQHEGFVEPSISEWSSPAISNETIKCITDFREADAMFERIIFSINRVDDPINDDNLLNSCQHFIYQRGFIRLNYQKIANHLLFFALGLVYFNGPEPHLAQKPALAYFIP